MAVLRCWGKSLTGNYAGCDHPIPLDLDQEKGSLSMIFLLSHQRNKMIKLGGISNGRCTVRYEHKEENFKAVVLLACTMTFLKSFFPFRRPLLSRTFDLIITSNHCTILLDGKRACFITFTARFTVIQKKGLNRDSEMLSLLSY